MGRLMGVDVGTRRIGIAFSDVDGSIATAHSTIEVDGGNRRAAKRAAELVEERDVETVVVGWPIRMDGSEGRAVEFVERFVAQLEEALAEIGRTVEIERWDERLSSSEAESVLIDADLSRSRRKGVVDRVAAARILQNYIDANLS